MSQLEAARNGLGVPWTFRDTDSVIQCVISTESFENTWKSSRLRCEVGEHRLHLVAHVVYTLTL